MASDLRTWAGHRATLRSRVPNALKLFLLTLAIVDDLGAVLVIALFCSQGIAISWLAGAAGAVTVIPLTRRCGRCRVLFAYQVAARRAK